MSSSLLAFIAVSIPDATIRGSAKMKGPLTISVHHEFAMGVPQGEAEKGPYALLKIYPFLLRGEEWLLVDEQHHQTTFKSILDVGFHSGYGIVWYIPADDCVLVRENSGVSAELVATKIRKNPSFFSDAVRAQNIAHVA